MKKIIIMLTAITLTVNLAACGKTPAGSVTNEGVYENMNSEVAKAGSVEMEPYVSPFSEYYTDPDTGLEFKLRSTSSWDTVNQYKYESQYITYEGPYSNIFSNQLTYYLKKDNFNDDYYNIFELGHPSPHLISCHEDFFSWLKDETNPESNQCNFKLYKFAFDSSDSSIQLEKKSLKKSLSQTDDVEEETTIAYSEDSDDTEKSTIEYTDDQLERFDRYREESDTEFIEDYMTNDLDHYEEDLDTIMEAIDVAIQEAENEKEERLRLRTKSEKLPDSENIGYLLTYEYKDRDDLTKACEPTYFNIIYGYEKSLDEFCVSISGIHYAKEHNYNTDSYENTAYDFESYLAALLSNLVKVPNKEVPQEEGSTKTLYVLENINCGNTIKIYDKDTYEFTHKPSFYLFEKTDYGIFDDTYKEKYFICEYNLLNDDEIEFLVKDYHSKDYYATCYTDNSTPFIALYFKPLLELKPGDPIIRFELKRETEASTELIEQVIDELNTMEVIYSYTEQYYNQQLPDHNKEMNIHTGMFKESDVKAYYTYELLNDVGIKVTVPEFHNSDFDNSEGISNVVEYLERTTIFGYSQMSLGFYRFCRSKEDIESEKQYSNIIEEWDINNHHCYLLGKEYNDSCYYYVYIEAKPSQYIEVSIILEGSYYYDKATHKDAIKNLISLIEIK